MSQDSSLSAVDRELHALARNPQLRAADFARELDALLGRGAAIEARDSDNRTPLMVATQHAVGAERVEALIRAGARVNAADHNGNTALHIAAHAGNFEAVDALLAAEADALAPNIHGMQPIHRAAMSGSPEAVFSLVEAGADVEATTIAGQTPLRYATEPHAPKPAVVGALIRLGLPLSAATHDGDEVAIWAAKTKHVGCVAALAGPDGVESLMERGAQLEANPPPLMASHLPLDFTDANAAGFSGVHMAAAHGEPDALSFFLSLGMGSSVPTLAGETPLHLAARSRNPGSALVIETLGQAGAALEDTQGEARLTPLMVAAQSDLGANVAALLKAGAQSAFAREDGRTAAKIAAAFGAAKALRAMAAARVDLGPGEGGVDWPLTEAAQGGHLEACEVILTPGMPIDAPDAAGRSALSRAASSGSRPVVDFFLGVGADPDAVDKAQRSPIIWAAYGGRAEIARALADAGARVDQPTSTGATALSIFAGRGNAPACEMLLAAGASPNQADLEGRTPLAQAALGANLAVIRAMLAHGGDPLLADGYGYTPILLAAQTRGSELGVVEMVERAKSVGPSLRDGRSALHLALASSPPVEVGDPGKHPAPFVVIQALIRAGADAKAADLAGNAPLHLAAKAATPEIVELLISRQADVDALDGAGHTPLMHAASAGAGRAVEILLRRHADADAVSPAGFTAFELSLMASHGDGPGRSAGAAACQRALLEASMPWAPAGAPRCTGPPSTASTPWSRACWSARPRPMRAPPRASCRWPWRSRPSTTPAGRRPRAPPISLRSRRCSRPGRIRT